MIERRAGVMPYFLKPYGDQPIYEGPGGSGLVIGMVSPLDQSKEEWLLPKGHVEDGETLIEAALREAWEEMGVVGSIRTTNPLTLSELLPLPSDGDANHLVPTLVVVTYYPMLVSNHESAVSPEGRKIMWVDKKFALVALTYPSHQLVVKRGING